MVVFTFFWYTFVFLFGPVLMVLSVQAAEWVYMLSDCILFGGGMFYLSFSVNPVEKDKGSTAKSQI